MAIQLSVAARNAKLDAIEAAIGTLAVLEIRSGAMPATCATATSGTLLSTMTLPSDWMAAASGGSKSKSGTWEQTSATAGGTAGYFRIYDATGATCHLQGTVTATGGGGDMTLSVLALTAAMDFVITSFTLTEANA